MDTAWHRRSLPAPAPKHLLYLDRVPDARLGCEAHDRHQPVSRAGRADRADPMQRAPALEDLQRAGQELRGRYAGGRGGGRGGGGAGAAAVVRAVRGDVVPGPRESDESFMDGSCMTVRQSVRVLFVK